jgi:2-C-methyl-D-erythritol 4-phosphate cytidylyltransferase
MGGAVPKQYLPLNGRLVIDHTLERLLAHPRVETVCVALAAGDHFWPRSAFVDDPRVLRVAGGRERCHSVRNALATLERLAAAGDWLLVHDAARPCLQRRDVDRLLQALQGHAVGGLLGVPVRDTMKRTNTQGAVVETVCREGLWHAYTPQMFRFALLKAALDRVLEQGALVTDDASAMELAGYQPLLIEGSEDNIKITRPRDLDLAAFYLARRG